LPSQPRGRCRSAVVLDDGRYACDSPSLAPEALNQAANILDPPGCYPGTELHRLGECARLYLAPESRRRKREDPWYQLRLADISRFRQRAERVGIIWHGAMLREAEWRDMEQARPRSWSRKSAWALVPNATGHVTASSDASANSVRHLQLLMDYMRFRLPSERTTLPWAIDGVQVHTWRAFAFTCGAWATRCRAQVSRYAVQ
jgi:hypothetical protein